VLVTGLVLVLVLVLATVTELGLVLDSLP